jgi:two-component system chemotaxis sensor kinase CheA
MKAMTMDFRKDEEIVNTFIMETMEHLTEMESGILLLENKTQAVDDELVHSMFRAAHSIKAGANLLEYGKIEELSHELESTLQKLRQRKLDLDEEIVNGFLHGIDQIGEMVNDIKT